MLILAKLQKYNFHTTVQVFFVLQYINAG